MFAVGYETGRVRRRHGVNTSIKREKKPAQDGTGGRTFWLAVAVVVAFNVLLAAWVLLQPAGPRVSPIISNVAGFVGPLLVLPLCFGALRQASRIGDRPEVITSQRWAPVLLGAGILSYAIGQVAFTWYVWALNQPPPMPSYATIGFLGQYPFLLLGILLL